MVGDSQKLKLISEFLIPDELKDDIAYCQRSLRDCVKVHQHFAKQCTRLSGPQQVVVRRFLVELEDEMRAIGKDQSELVQDLNNRLEEFLRKAATERRIQLADDEAKGYVAWVLSSHCEVQGTQAYVPRTVSERLNETQLYQKYRLDALPNADLELPEKRLRKRQVLQTSLLKPQTEREAVLRPNHPPKAAKTPSMTRQARVQSPPLPPTIAKMPPNSSNGGSSKRKVSPEQPTKTLRPRAVHVAMVKQKATARVKEEEPAEQDHEPGNDSEESVSAAVAAIRGLTEPLSVKQSRSNLRQALSKAKSNQKVSPSVSPNKSGRSNRPGGTVSIPPGQRSPSLSSESSNSRASTPGSNAGGGTRKQPPVATNNTSDESSNDRIVPLPQELTFQPCTTDDLDQYSFLKIFKLYTIEDSVLLKGRKNERKRRSCYSTERKEFHYGRWDCFEQQQYTIKRRGQGASKRLLCRVITAEKANKKRKPWPNGVTVPRPLVPAPPSVESATPAQELPPLAAIAEESSSLNDSENKADVCTCKTNESTDTVRACTKCNNILPPMCPADKEEEPDEKKAEPEEQNPSPPTDSVAVVAKDDDDDDDENQNCSTL